MHRGKLNVVWDWHPYLRDEDCKKEACEGSEGAKDEKKDV